KSRKGVGADIESGVFRKGTPPCGVRVESALRGEGIGAVGVGVADTTVGTVDDDFTAFAAGGGAGGGFSLRLGGMHRTDAGSAFAAGRPFRSMRDDVDAFRHFWLLKTTRAYPSSLE